MIDACGYDVDGFHHKQRMAIDEVTTTENNSKTTENEEGIEVIYEKLVSFIEEKPNFKLRCFDALVTKATEEDKEVLEEEGRDSSIKTAYIQIKMDMEAIEAIEIFLKLSEYSSNLLLKFQHEFFTENSISTWLKGLETVEFSEIETNWLAPVKLQPDSLNFSKDADEFFSAISEAFKLRNQLQNLVQDNFELLEFDKTDPNEIFLLPEKKLKAKITGNSIVWSLVEADGNVEDLISSLNSIGTKFRSVLDCLQAQIELLK